MLQMTELPEAGDSDLLPACIAELAAHYGVPFSASSIAALARDAQGRLPFHQAEAAIENAGLNFEPFNLRRLPATEDSYPALILLESGTPAIARQVANEDILVWRPETGEESWIPRKDLDKEFAGRFLTIFGDPDALREQDAPWHKKGRTHWFWSELRKERRSFRPVFLATLLVNLLAVALPLFSMNVYDRVIPNRASASLWVLAIGVVLAFAMEFALRSARTNVIDQIGRRLDLKLSQKIYSKLLGLPLASRRGSTGALAARVNEYAVVRDFFASTTIVLIVDMAFLFVFVAVIAYIAGLLALVPLVIMVLMVIAGFMLQRKVADAARDVQSDTGLQQTLLVESMAGAETLKSMAGEGSMIGRWYRLADIGGRSQQKLRHISSLAVGLTSTFQQISTISLIIGGYYLFDAGKITMGAIIAIVMLASRSLAPAGQIAFLLTRARQAKEALASIEDLFEGEDERRMGRTAPPSVPRRSRIVLEDCTFAYPDTNVPALDGVNLTIEPGERIALIGRVASGKSTLGRLLAGLYQPTEGSMLVNGLDSRQFRPADLRRAFRFVGQDSLLFTGSVKDNLLLTDPAASEDQLLAALHASGADQFVARDATGFDRLVGEYGRRLSGGQRSFLALARAFVAPCDVLILDEPTGAMDSQTERVFADRLMQSLPAEQTLIVATHRPALFDICSRIVVLDQGKIIADGPKQDILASAGRNLGMGA